MVIELSLFPTNYPKNVVYYRLLLLYETVSFVICIDYQVRCVKST
jgi:hypothetical protein